MKIALMLARLLLGGVFLLSGVLKLLSPTQASEFFSQVTSIDLSVSRILIILFCCLEIGLAFMLFLGRRLLSVTAFVSSSFLLLFTFAGFVVSDGSTSCGCFGEIMDSKIDGDFVMRNFMLLAISMFILKSADTINNRDKT